MVVVINNGNPIPCLHGSGARLNIAICRPTLWGDRGTPSGYNRRAQYPPLAVASSRHNLLIITIHVLGEKLNRAFVSRQCESHCESETCRQLSQSLWRRSNR